MKKVRIAVAVIIAVMMLCTLLSGCGGAGLDKDGHITLDSAKTLGNKAVKDYIAASSSITNDYYFYSSYSGSTRQDITDDENAIILSYNTEGSQILIDGEEYTDEDIVVLVSGDGTNVTVIAAPDMESSPVDPIDEQEYISMSTIEGYWKYDDYDDYFAIIETGEWTLYDVNGDVQASGTLTYENGVMTLSSTDLTQDITLTANSYDLLTDIDGDTLSRYNPDDAQG